MERTGTLVQGRLQLCGGRGDAIDPVERDAHWSFAFYGEPELDICVDSTLRGKTVARMTSLIQTIVRNAFRKRHVLPTYRAQYLLKDRLVIQQPDSIAVGAQPPNNETLSVRAHVGTLAVRGMCKGVLHGGAAIVYANVPVWRFIYAVDCLNNILHTTRRDAGFFSVYPRHVAIGAYSRPCHPRPPSFTCRP